MTDHPLTDDIIESELATPTHFASGSLVGLFTHDDMRAAYDLGVQACIDWLHDYPSVGMFPPDPEWLGEKMEEKLLAHRGVLQSDQATKEES